MGTETAIQRELHFANQLWGPFEKVFLDRLSLTIKQHGLSVLLGDLVLINGNPYVTHSGLLRIACAKRCRGIDVHPVKAFSNPATSSFAFRATVHPSSSSRGFTGYGDANPTNISAVMQGAEMRIAETRAVNRALRKAYGIGICSIEELSSVSWFEKSKHVKPEGNGLCGRTVRDRLCQIIRKHQLEPRLVKAYAVDFCGVKLLREATRDQIEKFVLHLAEFAEKDRDALLCQLNSYPSEQGGVQ